MDEKYLYWAELIKRYLLQQCSVEEYRKLEEWVNQSPENYSFFQKISSREYIKKKWSLHEAIDVQAAIRRFDSRTQLKHILKARYYRIGISIAAAVMAILFVIPLFLQKSEKAPIPLSQKTTDISPGSTKAILKLENGNVFQLEECDSVRIEEKVGLSITRQGKMLNCQTAGQRSELHVPRGGEYTLALADGSIVQLNSGTILKFPVDFDQDKREVELYGEAYFEIARDKARPFLVTTTGMTINVYGTNFNVNTRDIQQIQTVLVTGEVGITIDNTSEEYFLKPSQLAEFDSETGKIQILEVDLNPYISWTNGVFMFDSMPLDEIMETLSLWYDVEVFFTHASLKQLHFTGSLNRYSPISIILETLAHTVGIKVQQEGRTIIIE